MVGLLFLAACAQEYTFEQGFKDMRKIDEKYSINFHREKLNGTMVKMELVNEVLRDLEELEQKVKKKQGTEVQDVLDLITVRKKMIESQRYWILAKQIGPQGVTRDGFTCADALEVREATLYYAQSWQYAIDAQRLLDEILARNLASWEFIGTDREKPEFYRSKLDYIAEDIRFNIINMRETCKIVL